MSRTPDATACRGGPSLIGAHRKLAQNSIFRLLLKHGN
ncbi:hypothetical protein C7S17_7030 [Burkholderia thailandensis]|nr:hypothetical protein [Burkholderia thailandensis]